MFDLVEPVKGELPCRAERFNNVFAYLFFRLCFLSFPFSFFLLTSLLVLLVLVCVSLSEWMVLVRGLSACCSLVLLVLCCVEVHVSAAEVFSGSWINPVSQDRDVNKSLG